MKFSSLNMVPPQFVVLIKRLHQKIDLIWKESALTKTTVVNSENEWRLLQMYMDEHRFTNPFYPVIETIPFTLVDFICHFPTPFFLRFDRIIGNKIYLNVSSRSAEPIQNYVCLMKCLFQHEFRSTNTYTGGTYEGRKRKIQQTLFCQWELTDSVYQQSLQLFPAWPISMRDEWYSAVFKLLDELFPTDLANFCLQFLRPDPSTLSHKTFEFLWTVKFM